MFAIIYKNMGSKSIFLILILQGKTFTKPIVTPFKLLISKTFIISINIIASKKCY